MLSLWFMFSELNSSLSILYAFCSKPIFRNSKIIIAKILLLLRAKHYWPKNCPQLPLAFSQCSRTHWTWMEEAGWRGHTSALAQRGAPLPPDHMFPRKPKMLVSL